MLGRIEQRHPDDNGLCHAGLSPMTDFPRTAELLSGHTGMPSVRTRRDVLLLPLSHLIKGSTQKSGLATEHSNS